MARSASQSKPKFSYPKLCFVSLCSSPNHSSLNSWRPILAIVLASYFPLTYLPYFCNSGRKSQSVSGFAANNLHSLGDLFARRSMKCWFLSNQLKSLGVPIHPPLAPCLLVVGVGRSKRRMALLRLFSALDFFDQTRKSVKYVSSTDFAKVWLG